MALKIDSTRLLPFQGDQGRGVNDCEGDETVVEKGLEPIYTVPEVAQYLKISKSKAYHLVQRREIPYIRIGKNVRIRHSDLMQWLDENTKT